MLYYTVNNIPWYNHHIDEFLFIITQNILLMSQKTNNQIKFLILEIVMKDKIMRDTDLGVSGGI